MRQWEMDRKKWLANRLLSVVKVRIEPMCFLCLCLVTCFDECGGWTGRRG
jgi:hypothetical protein